MGGIIQVYTIARVIFGSNETVAICCGNGRIEVKRIFAVMVQNTVGKFFKLVASRLFPIVGLVLFAVRPVIGLSKVVRLRGRNPHGNTGLSGQRDNCGEMLQLSGDGNTVRHVVGGHVDDNGIWRKAEGLGNVSFRINLEQVTPGIIRFGSGGHNGTSRVAPFGQVDYCVGGVERLQIAPVLIYPRPIRIGYSGSRSC